MMIEIETWDQADGKGIDDLLAGGKAPVTQAPEAVLPTINRAAGGHTEPTTRRPRIEVGGDLPRMTMQGLQALALSNDPPRLFAQGSSVVRVERIEDDRGQERLVQAVLNEHACRGELARAACWFKTEGKNDAEREVEVLPPVPVVLDLMNRPAEDRTLPRLSRIVRVPVFCPDGSLVAVPGYHAASGILYDPDSGLPQSSMIPPRRPTQEEIVGARRLLLEELLSDFPFVDQASRAHALAALLQPFCRGLINGNTPLHHVGAPAEGTGKGLFVKAILRPALGEEDPAEIHQADSANDEWRKGLSSALAGLPVVVLLDNLEGRLSSGRLASALTASTWDDRETGSARRVRVPIRCLWLSTGNNVIFHREIARRTVSIDLDARCAHPEERSGFRHPDLLAWADEHRPELVRACLTLIAAWIGAGCPTWKPGPDAPMLGSFEAWCRTMGGILDAAGVPGFLTNRKATKARTGQSEEQTSAFLRAWWDRHNKSPITVADLFPLVEECKLLDTELRSSTERGRRTQLGAMILRLVGRHVEVAGGTDGAKQIILCVNVAGKHRDGGARYALSEETQNPPEGCGTSEGSAQVPHPGSAPENPDFIGNSSPVRNLRNLIPPHAGVREDHIQTDGLNLRSGPKGREKVPQVPQVPRTSISSGFELCGTCAEPAEGSAQEDASLEVGFL